MSYIFSLAAPKGLSRNETHVGDSHSCKETVELDRTQATVSDLQERGEPAPQPPRAEREQRGGEQGQGGALADVRTSQQLQTPPYLISDKSLLPISQYRERQTRIPYPDARRGM